MKIRERLKHLNQQMSKSMHEGTSAEEISMYESTMSEMKRVSDWLKTQCQTRNTLFFEHTDSGTKSYLEFQNTSGMDFKFITMGVSVYRGSTQVDRFEIGTVNWQNGQLARLYLIRDIQDGESLSFNPEDVEYQII